MNAILKSKRARAIRYKPLPVPLDQPARLRVGHLMLLYLCSHTTVYVRLRQGHIPKPDGRDPRPYWLTSTIRPHFEKEDGNARTPENGQQGGDHA